MLRRRWRHIFGHVDTVSYKEEEGGRSADWESHYFEAKEYKSCSHVLLDGINGAALLPPMRMPPHAVVHFLIRLR